MAVKAKLKYLRIAPRKVRLVADMVRGKKVNDALDILSFVVKRAAKPLKKLLQSAIANAENNFKLDKDNLFISKILVNEGPKLKRFMPRAMGRAFMIQKKTSHIEIELDEIKKNDKTDSIASGDKKPRE
ncbi:50S ribosomal protein L22 [bacterium HR34]|nr:50S ribosomal protein L22 [bacterium HR34]